MKSIDQVMLGASGTASASGLSRFSRLQGLIRRFNSSSQQIRYGLHPERPDDAHGSLRGGLDSRAVPATEIAHVYEKQRTQARGVP